MVGFDDLKSSLTAYILKLGRVTYQDLLKWASSNNVGYLVLYFALRDVIKDRQWKVSGEYVIASFKVNGEELRLTIPMYIDVATKSQKAVIRTEREKKQRRARGASILDIIKVDEQKTSAEASAVSTSYEKEESKVQEQTAGQEVKAVNEVKSNEEVREGGEQLIEGGEAKLDISNMEVNSFMRMLRDAVAHEFIGNTDLAYKVAISILSYLGKYWSVGELRLKIDVAKQVSGRVDDSIIRIEDGVLRILRRMGIIEIVEPGVINRIKELPKDFVKLKLDYMLDNK